LWIKDDAHIIIDINSRAPAGAEMPPAALGRPAGCLRQVTYSELFSLTYVPLALQLLGIIVCVGQQWRNVKHDLPVPEDVVHSLVARLAELGVQTASVSAGEKCIFLVSKTINVGKELEKNLSA
jgi:hypothetical protein